MVIDTNNEDENDSASVAASSEKPPKTSTIIDVVLSGAYRKSAISTAQLKCLDMQQQQHEAEMAILELKKSCIVQEHKRKMEVLDAEYAYWTDGRRMKHKKKHRHHHSRHHDERKMKDQDIDEWEMNDKDSDAN